MAKLSRSQAGINMDNADASKTLLKNTVTFETQDKSKNLHNSKLAHSQFKEAQSSERNEINKKVILDQNFRKVIHDQKKVHAKQEQPEHIDEVSKSKENFEKKLENFYKELENAKKISHKEITKAPETQIKNAPISINIITKENFNSETEIGNVKKISAQVAEKVQETEKR